MDKLRRADMKNIDYSSTALGEIVECIETNIWLSRAYANQGARGLSKECLRIAEYEWKRFESILDMPELGVSIEEAKRNCEELCQRSATDSILSGNA